VIIYRQQSFAFFTLLEHMDMTLNLKGQARRRAQAKTRRLLQDAAAGAAPPTAAPEPAADAPTPAAGSAPGAAGAGPAAYV
jgi:hypothetical protein